MRFRFGVSLVEVGVLLLAGCGGATASSEQAGAEGQAPPPEASRPFRTVAAPTRRDLFGVWAHSASLAFAVGDGATVLRWDGAAWRAEELPSTVRRDVRFAHVAGTGPSDVWVVGANIGDAPFGQETLVHFDGTTWTDLSAELSRGVYPLTGIHVASGEVFVTAYDIERAYVAVLARDPAARRWVGIGAPALRSPKIHGRGSEVVVADDRNVYRRTVDRGWEPVGPPTVGAPMTANLRALFAQANGRLWLGGENGEVVVGTEGRWRSLRAGEGWVTSLWASPDGLAWVVMSGSSVYACATEGCTAQLQGTHRLFATGGTSDGDVWVVGGEGTILHRP